MQSIINAVTNSCAAIITGSALQAVGQLFIGFEVFNFTNYSFFEWVLQAIYWLLLILIPHSDN